jgi:hypothetical protein
MKTIRLPIDLPPAEKKRLDEIKRAMKKPDYIPFRPTARQEQRGERIIAAAGRIFQ